MTWTTLPTYVNGVLTAAQLNAIADNIEETAVAKATTAAQYFVATGANVLAARTISQGLTNGADTTTSTSYTSLSSTGPDLSVTTGTRALIWINAQQANDTAQVGVYTSYSVTGATAITADDDWAFVTNAHANEPTRGGVCKYETLTAGVNSVNMRYRVVSNTGNWLRRRSQVMSL